MRGRRAGKKPRVELRLGQRPHLPFSIRRGQVSEADVVAPDDETRGLGGREAALRALNPRT
ncbi:MAG TPA: hypothetical protein VEL80_00385 [Burkholderiales bacterium]|nr:hypothetical protein [Burkholderiales bacterium]